MYREYVREYLNNADPAHGFDIASFDSYPFYKSGQTFTYYSLHFQTIRIVMEEAGSKPVWYYPAGWAIGGSNLAEPDENMLRYMCFTPVAYGVKGLIWFGYTRGMGDFNSGCMETYYWDPAYGTGNSFACPPALVDYWSVPTPKYYSVRRLNHYVRDVLGPVVMNSTRVGTFHQSNQPSNEVIPSSEIIGPTTPIVTSLGDPNGMVGIFQPTTPAGSYYLLIVNKALTPKTMVVSLNGSWDVGAAPRADGYVGGNNYISVAANIGGGATTFGLTLSGGEGRMIRIQPPGTGVYLTMLSPTGGGTMQTGQQQQTTWWPSGSSQSVRVYADATENGTTLTGPSVVTNPNVSGFQTWVTIPDMMTTRGRIEITSTGSDGQSRRDYHPMPFKVLPSMPMSWLFSSLGGQQAFFQHSLAVDAQARGRVAYFDAVIGHLRYSRHDGSTWVHEIVPDGGTGPWITVGTQGIAPSIAIDAAGHPHIAYYWITSWTQSQLHYAFHDGSAWTIENLGTVGIVDGNCSIAVTAAGVPIIAYNGGTAGNRALVIKSRTAPGTWSAYGGSTPASGPQSITARLDGSGTLWVAFIDQNQGRLGTYRVTPSQSTLVLSRAGTFRDASIAVEPGGTAHLAYSASGAPTGSQILLYDRYNGTQWLASPETADGTLGTVEGVSIVQFMGQPQISYAGNGVAKFANKTLGAWYRDAIDGSGDMTGPVSMGLGGSGERWVAYADRGGKTYKVASPAPEGGGGDPCEPCTPCNPCEILPAIRSVMLMGPNPVRFGQPITLRVQTSTAMSLDMGLFDVAGRRVSSLDSRRVPPGLQTIQWSPESARPGIHFLRVRSEQGTELSTRLLILQ